MLHQQVMNDEGNRKTTTTHGPHDAGKKKALLIYSAFKKKNSCYMLIIQNI